MSADKIADFLITFLSGLAATGTLMIVTFIIWVIIKSPLELLYTAGGIVFIYSLGWCIRHLDEFRALLKGNVIDDSANSSTTVTYENPILNNLARLEQKYGMNTLTFMAYVAKGYMFTTMDNLDYIEWLGLVNELSSIRGIDPQKGGR